MLNANIKKRGEKRERRTRLTTGFDIRTNKFYEEQVGYILTTKG